MAVDAGTVDTDAAAALDTAARARKPDSDSAAGDSHRTVDAEHPWLGLASFTEETRTYFFGREQEVAELSRRVQRKLLTILFGQSGLGKTSILRAGIVPKLRPAGYCPVYVRIDYSSESPPPAEQIKEAIFRATQAHGQWTQAGIAVEGESLWEFLHHRGDVLKDSRDKTVVPLLIFDQFEEIFTLAQADEQGRKRAAEFIEDLADLVENRPPKALEARIDSDDSFAERFDFARADYRILIALREDYLAHLEGVKGAMPSITQNRMRLAPMTGQQALAAVTKPGGKLVSEEVAESIVRFIAGGSEIPNAEVEPSLLSLICRELNNARVAQGRSEISVDLLAGSNETILAEFYERALADQPPAVRRFIEDEMLTDSGYRESLAEERVRKAFNTAGATADALAKLVDRRLLRIEERLDLRRVELTHDVLCNVVAASRDLRHEREARDEAERQLVAQKAREAATRRALIRARQVAAVCAVLAIGAAGSAIFGYQNMKRAQSAEAQAQQVRGMAESARGESEKLIVYLLDDFYLELEPIGRLDIVADLAKRALSYYKELPVALRTPETERNRALALVRYGAVLAAQAKTDEADVPLAEAAKVLGGLRSAGDTSETTTLGLAKAKYTQARVLSSRGNLKEAVQLAEESLKLLTPLAEAPGASKAVLRAEGEVRIHLGWALLRTGVGGDAVLERAQAVYRKLGALDLSDHSAAAAYAEAGTWLGETLLSQGKEAEARKVLQETLLVSTRVVEARPGHMKAIRTMSNAGGYLGQNEFNNLRIASALALGIEAERGWESLVKMDSSVSSSWNNLAVARVRVADDLFGLGRVEESVAKRREAVTVADKTPVDGFLALNLAFFNAWLADAQANFEGADKAGPSLAAARKFEALAASKASTGARRELSHEAAALLAAQVLLTSGEYAEFLKQAQEVLRRMRAIRAEGALQDDEKRRWQSFALELMARAMNQTGDHAAAEKAARESLELRSAATRRSLRDDLRVNEVRTELAMAIARQGRLKEADEIIQPVLNFHRQLQQRRVDDVVQHVLLSRALLVSALASPGARTAQLAEAGAIMDRLPPQTRRWKNFALLRDEIAAEQKKRP